MSKLSAKVFAAIVSLSVVSPVSVTQARIFDLKEQVIYTEAFSEFVQSYDKAHEVYKKQGPQAFVDTLMPGSSTDEKKYLKKALGSLPRLPKVTSDSALLIIDGTNLGAGIHTIEVSNIDDGMLIVDGNPVEFDPTKKDIESLSKKIESSLDRSTVKTSMLEQVEMIIMPSAHASAGKAAVWVVLGAVGGVATNWVWNKWKNRDSESQVPKLQNEDSTSSH